MIYATNADGTDQIHSMTKKFKLEKRKDQVQRKHESLYEIRNKSLVRSTLRGAPVALVVETFRGGGFLFVSEESPVKNDWSKISTGDLTRGGNPTARQILTGKCRIGGGTMRQPRRHRAPRPEQRDEV